MWHSGQETKWRYFFTYFCQKVDPWKYVVKNDKKFFFSKIGIRCSTTQRHSFSFSNSQIVSASHSSKVYYKSFICYEYEKIMVDPMFFTIDMILCPPRSGTFPLVMPLFFSLLSGMQVFRKFPWFRKFYWKYLDVRKLSAI